MQLHAMHTIISLMQPSAHKYAKDSCKATQDATLSFAIMLRDCPVTSYEVMYGVSKLDLAYRNCLHWQVPKGSLADEQRKRQHL